MVEHCLEELEADGVGQGNQVNILRTVKAILLDAYDKGAMADRPVKECRSRSTFARGWSFRTWPI
ncbi:hypothetical protein SUDANB105_00810 [Streptomyces sp. enrichment culture]